MSRLVLFLGILLILIGGAGLIFGLIGAPVLIASSAAQLTNPKAADLCNPGEQLVTERGAESYSFSTGYSHSQYYYCVNDAGIRREVTDKVAQNFIAGFLPSLGSLAIPILSGGLCTFGFFMALIGFIFSRRRSFRSATTPYVFAGPGAPPAYRMAPSATGDLAAKLRQLEDARTSGLISEDEYTRMRDEILGAMK